MISVTVARRTVLHIVLGLLPFAASFSQAVQYQKSYEDAMAQAQASGKLVIVDFYATWCGPCKLMDTEVFSDHEVCHELNNKFINLKLDVDAGGKALAKKYSVMAMPSFVVVDGSGKEMTRFVGYMNKARFLDQISYAFSTSYLGQLYATIKQGFEEGKLDCKETSTYLKLRRSIGESSDAILDSLLAGKLPLSHDTECKDRLVLENATRLTGSAFDYLMARKEESHFNNKLKAMVSMSMTAAIKEKNSDQFDQILSVAQQIAPSVEEGILAEGRLVPRFYLETKQRKEFTVWAERFIPQQVLPRLEIGVEQFAPLFEEFMRLYVEHVNKDKSIVEALKWSDRALAAHPTSNSYLLSARLHLKIGNKNQSILAAKESKVLAEKKGEATLEIDKFLAELE